MNKLNTKERGAIAIMTALMLIMLLIFTAFAVDFGYHYVVKNEVQNSADAAALSGATVFFRNGVNPDNFAAKGGPASTTTNCTGTSITKTAACTAAAAIGLNEHSTYQFAVNVDLWNNLSPAAPIYPAVKVDLTRTFVPFFFARVIGFDTRPIFASATAIARSQSTPAPAPLLPVALNDCVFQGPGGVWTSRVGQTLMYNTAYPSALCNSMQWTSLAYDVKMGASDIWTIINSGSSAQIAPAPNAPNATASDCIPPGADGIDTCIYLDPGVKESVFRSLDDLVGRVFSVPVVADVPKKSGNQPVQKIACVRLENVCDTPGFGGYHGVYTGGNPNSTETPGGKPSSCPGNKTYFSVTILNDSECSATGTGGGMTYGIPSPPQLAD
jgi:hypothetical protein